MIVGIDLGTTFSAVATVDPSGRPTVVRNELAELTTPSVLYFESASTVLVGTAAVSAASLDQDNGVALIKRRMGTDFELLFHGMSYRPESVSALILRSLVAGFGTVGEPIRAVITVPAYFGVAEREATHQAAQLAGIEVLELLAEPVAAALHYCAAERSGSSGGTVLVYDLGGGTFDTTVLRVTQDGVRVVATDGDSQLGGADWDSRIADHLTASFAAAEPEVDVDDDAFRQEILRLAESAKRALSVAVAKQVLIRFAGRSVNVDLTRDALSDLGQDLIKRTLDIVDRVLYAASGQVRRVDDVIMVGGSAKMTAVAAALAERLGRTPRLVEPDLAVVHGAAIRAHQLADKAARATLTKAGGMLAAIADRPTTTVLPRSFGVLVHDSADPDGERQYIWHAVHRNTPLPASATVSLATILENQDRIRVQVFEQAGDLPSSELPDNRRVLDGELSGLPKLRAGALIHVTFDVDAGGRLRVTAREPTSGRDLTIEAYVDGALDAAAADAATQVLTGVRIGQ